MKTTRLSLILSLIFIMLSGNIYGQRKKKNNVAQPSVVSQEKSKVHIALTARSYGDSIVLRWGYKDAFAFRTFKDLYLKGLVWTKIIRCRKKHFKN